MGKKEIINIFTKPLEEVTDDKMNIEDLQDLVMDIRSKSNDVITENKEEAILKSFIYGYPSSFAFKLSTTDDTLKTPINLSIVSVEYKKTKYNFSTLTSRAACCVLYLDYSSEETDSGSINTINVCSRINPKWLIYGGYFKLDDIKRLNHQNIFYNIMDRETLYGDSYSRFASEIIDNYRKKYCIWITPLMPTIYYYYMGEEKNCYLHIRYNFNNIYMPTNVNARWFEIERYIDRRYHKNLEMKKGIAGSITINILVSSKIEDKFPNYSNYMVKNLNISQNLLSLIK